MPPASFQELSNFIWSIADLLRGPSPRLLAEIDAELDEVEKRILSLLKEVTE